MVEFKKGNILAEDAEALVNTVNCVGVMGRGVALQFKKAFPDNFHAYARACDRKDVKPGRMFVFETGRLDNPRYIVNFPTKRHWRGKSRIEDIENGLDALVAAIGERNIRSIAVPPLGSGLGGLDWSDVRPRIEAALRPLEETRVTVFEPAGAPKAGDMAHVRTAPRMTRGRASLLVLTRRYLEAGLDPFVTLLELHKLTYFMQAAGEPLRLSFAKGPYGPYAENLRHVLNRIEGHFMSGYADGGDAPDKAIELVPGALDRAMNSLKKHEETHARVERVADLVSGFESGFGLELLATVHWVRERAPAVSTDVLVARVHEWSERKKRFSPRQIALASDRLAGKGWFRTARPEQPATAGAAGMRNPGSPAASSHALSRE